MKTINLLPWREIQKKRQLRKQKLQFALILFLAIIILISWHGILIKLLNQKTHDETELIEQLDKLMQIEKQQNFQIEQNRLQKAATDKVTKLINEQNIAANFLLILSNAINKNVYFTGMQKKDNLVALQGIAISYGDLSELLKRLSAINDFKTVQLLEVTNHLTNENLNFFKFSLLIQFNL